MANVTIASQVTEFEWAGATPPRLRIYAKVPFIAAGGVPVHAGNQYGGRAYRDVACTLDGSNRVVTPAVTLPSTTDSDKPDTAQYVAFLYSRGADLSSQFQEFSEFASGFSLPDDPTSTTWEDIALNMGSPSGPITPADRTINNLTVVQDASVGDDLTVGDDLNVGDDITAGGTITAAGFAGDGSLLTGVTPVGGSGGSSSTGSHTFWADTDDNDAAAIADTKVGAVTVTRAHRDYFRIFKPLRPAGYATGSLPAASAGDMAYDTDRKGPVYHNGNAWQLFSRHYDIQAFGAVGDGSADDTAAINAAIAALNSAGGGVLYVPFTAAYYKVTAALTTITVPFIVRGDGSGSSPSAVEWSSKIVMTSRTANLFTVTADSGNFEHLYLFNSNSTFNGATVPATPPTAGAAVQVTAASSSQRVNIDDCVIEGFYDNIRQDGAHWALTRSHLINQVRYGLYVHNTINADVGDWSISDTHFSSKTYRADAFLRIEDAGGGKLQNVKMNSFDDPGVAGVQGYDYGISVEYTATSILLLSNVSIENYLTHAIHAVGVSLFSFSNLQIADYVSAGTTPGILLDDCSYGKIDAVIRTNVATSEPGIKCVDCSHIAQGTIINFGYDGAFQFVTSYATDYTDLTLAAGWTNTGGTFKNAAYRYQNGQIRLRGLVSYGGGGTTTIATLPAHLWPSGDLIFPAVANGAFQRIRININGTIVQEGGGPTTLQSLEGIYYDHQ